MENKENKEIKEIKEIKEKSVSWSHTHTIFAIFEILILIWNIIIIID